MSPPIQVGGIVEGWLRLGMTAEALWVGYFALGGDGSLADVQRWLAGQALSGRDHNLLAAALNEEFTEQGLDHPVPYRDRS